MLLAALLLAAAATPEAVCGDDPLLFLRRALLEDLNRARIEHGSAPVEPHPLLCELAAGRAREVAARGSTRPSMALLNETTRAFYRAGYPPFRWAQSSLVADPLRPALEQWREVRPDFAREAVEEEFEHVGIAAVVRGGQPHYAVLLALHKCTEEWRRAQPLRDLEASRRQLLAAFDRVREAEGLEPVAADPVLDRAAQAHAEDMLARGYYSHRSPEGTEPRERIRDAGYPRLRWSAENIAKGLFTPSEAIERWMGSSGHRGNLLRTGAAATGVGIAVGRAPSPECVEVLWVHLFAG